MCGVHFQQSNLHFTALQHKLAISWLCTSLCYDTVLAAGISVYKGIAGETF
jgi:hypothetical protein